MGSKRRFAKQLLPIILKNKKVDQWFVEPFCGSCSITENVSGLRIANDIQPYLIAMYKAVQDGWIPPSSLTKDEYQHIKNNIASYPPELVGFVGFGVSFGGKWMGSYAQDGKGVRNMCDESARNVLKQKDKLSGVIFKNVDYTSLEIPPNAVIYCDPPYENTTGYKLAGEFDHISFWNWVRDKSQYHDIFISEYNAPDDFVLVHTIETTTSMNNIVKNKKATEKLFISKEQYERNKVKHYVQRKLFDDNGEYVGLLR